MKVLSKKGLERISELQDKYRFMDKFEIIEPEEVLEFLRNLKEAEYLGLDIDQADSELIDEMLENLMS